MKRALVFWIIAAVLLFAAIGMFVDAEADKGAAAFALICAVVLGVIGFVRYKNKDKAAARAAEKAEAKAKAAAPERCFRTKAAGVTFTNDDGSSRQDILRASAHDGDEWETVPCSLERFEYEGEPAIRIMLGRDCIGSVTKTDVAKVLELYGKITKVQLTPDEFWSDEGKRVMRADVDIWYKD